MNQQTFQRSLKLLGDATNKALSPDLIRFWWTRYGDLPDDVLLTAFELALQQCKFFPSPAEFTELLTQVAGRGLESGGAAVWEAMHQTMFSVWSETRDRVMLQDGTRYPWPDDRARAILRDRMNLTVRRVAEMHPKDYEAARQRFIQQYDGAQAVERAEAQALDAGNVRRLPQGAD